MTKVDHGQAINEVYEPLFTEKPRYIILMGGRGAGRSKVASQRAVAKIQEDTYYRCAIMRLVLGDIRNSIYQDIYDTFDETGVLPFIDVREHILTFEYGDNRINGIGFKKSSGQQKSKLKSLANYNEVIIEEADETAEEDFMQLDDSLRTKKSDITVILLLNPPHRNHWIIKRWFNLEESGVEGYYKPILKDSCKHDTLFIHTNFRDNLRNVDEKTVANFLRYKETKPDHYYNMIEGLVSEGARGRIYRTWQRCTAETFDSLPFKSIYALDFGFTNDPTALVELKQHNEKVWARGLIYDRGLTNKLISKRFTALGMDKRTAVIYADNAEPKSIQELRDDGWDVRPASKGQDSVRAGIDMLLSKEVFYVENVEMENEIVEYKWSLDQNKEPTNEPIDDFNHYMDAIRYGVWTENNKTFIGFV